MLRFFSSSQLVKPGRLVIPSLSQPRSAARAARNLLWNSHVTSKLAFYHSLAWQSWVERPVYSEVNRPVLSPLFHGF